MMTKFNPDDYIHLPTLGLSDDEIRSLEACKEIEAIEDQFKSPPPLTDDEEKEFNRLIERANELMSVSPPPDRRTVREELHEEFKDNPLIRDALEAVYMAIPFCDLRSDILWPDTINLARRISQDKDPDPVSLSLFMAKANNLIALAGSSPWNRFDNIPRMRFSSEDSVESEFQLILSVYRSHGGDSYWGFQ